MELFNADALLSLFTLTTLEIILGIDNVIFIALLIQRLKGRERKRARVIGLGLALGMRILMLLGATWIMKMTHPLFTVLTIEISGQSLLLIIGGLFLVVKSIMELLELFDPEHEEKKLANPEKKYFKVIYQIVFIDIVLSFDSIITAVGMTDNFPVMVIAIVIAMFLMLVGSEPISKFIYTHPSIKVIVLAFIALVGVMLLLNGLDIPFNKGYLYFAMFFAGIVEAINIYLRKIQSS